MHLAPCTLRKRGMPALFQLTRSLRKKRVTVLGLTSMNGRGSHDRVNAGGGDGLKFDYCQIGSCVGGGRGCPSTRHCSQPSSLLTAGARGTFGLFFFYREHLRLL